MESLPHSGQHALRAFSPPLAAPCCYRNIFCRFAAIFGGYAAFFAAAAAIAPPAAASIRHSTAATVRRTH